MVDPPTDAKNDAVAHRHQTNYCARGAARVKRSTGRSTSTATATHPRAPTRTQRRKHAGERGQGSPREGGAGGMSPRITRGATALPSHRRQRRADGGWGFICAYNEGAFAPEYQQGYGGSSPRSPPSEAPGRDAGAGGPRAGREARGANTHTTAQPHRPYWRSLKRKKGME